MMMGPFDRLLELKLAPCPLTLDGLRLDEFRQAARPLRRSEKKLVDMFGLLGSTSTKPGSAYAGVSLVGSGQATAQ